MEQATITFYNDCGCEIVLRVDPRDLYLAERAQDSWDTVEEIRLDNPSGTHASWPVEW